MAESFPLSDGREQRARGPLALTLLIVLGCLLCAGFVALGNWQVRRLAWKEALIAHTRKRVHAAPVNAPGPAEWAGLNADNAAYRHVFLCGRWIRDHQTRVWTATEKGSGYWILTPLRRDDGSVVLVNRGFAPQGWCDLKGHCPQAPAGEMRVTGLLRLSEPSGFFRHNQPARNIWYNRDVPAIARARGLTNVAPYFVDADRHPNANGKPWPQGGMTVIHFRNHHLSYLITWYVLALMTLAAMLFLLYDAYRLRRRLKNE